MFPPKNCPFPLGDQVPHLTHGTYGAPESLTHTAFRSVQLFSYSPKCYALQYIVSGVENNCPFPLGFRHPAGGGTSHCDWQHAQKLVKIARVVREICSRQTDRQTHTHTDAHITILRHRSNNCARQ